MLASLEGMQGPVQHEEHVVESTPPPAAAATEVPLAYDSYQKAPSTHKAYKPKAYHTIGKGVRNSVEENGQRIYCLAMCALNNRMIVI